jgi:hypothetical protein
MRVNLFDFDLPPERIAAPADPRDAARLLIIRPKGSPRFDGRAASTSPVYPNRHRQSRRQVAADALGVTLTLARRANVTTITRSINLLGLGPGLRAPRELASMHGAA